MKRSKDKMTITITMELNEQNLEKLKALLPDATMEVKAETKQVKKTKVQKQEPVEQLVNAFTEHFSPQDTADTDKVDVPQQPIEQPKKQEITITKEDIRAEALALAQAGKNDKIAEIFKKFGKAKLSDFDNDPAMYPALMEALKNVATC